MKRACLSKCIPQNVRACAILLNFSGSKSNYTYLWGSQLLHFQFLCTPPIIALLGFKGR
jgi:hypothetical protein